MLSFRQVAMVLAVLAVACGGEPRLGPRAVGTVIIEPPLDPATEAEVMRSRTIAERVAERIGGDAAAAAALRGRVRTRAVRDTRIVEVAVAVTPSEGAVTAIDQQNAVALCNQWVDTYAETIRARALPDGGPGVLPLRVLDRCRIQ